MSLSMFYLISILSILLILFLIILFFISIKSFNNRKRLIQFRDRLWKLADEINKGELNEK